MPKKSSFAKLHHVGVVVKDINKAIAYFESLGIGPFAGPGDSRPWRYLSRESYTVNQPPGRPLSATATWAA